MHRVPTSPFFRLRAATAAAILVFCAATAHAQFDTAQLSGVIKDTTGAVLPGVDVTLKNSGTGQERHAVTNQDGVYQFANVLVGSYNVSATLSGFNTITRTGLQVSAGVNIRLDLQMTLGTLSETVQVQAAAIQTDTAVIGRTVRAEQLAEAPLSGRRAAQIAQLSAGVVGGAMSTFGGAALGSFFTGVSSINGGRSDEFMTTVDGAPSIRVRAAGGYMMGAQSMDTVAEVQVLTTNYQAEFGRSSAGQLRMVTKSGTQTFHGNAFWNGQNDALDANTWIRNKSGLPKTPHRYNADGWTLGGPIYVPGRFNESRQRLFFFWGEEWVRDRSVANQTAIVPTAAMRRGDFSELLDPNNPFFHRVRTIVDPLTGRPFAGNIIPANRLSPNGLAILNSFPMPTPGFLQGSSNWIGALPVFNNQRKDSIKIDWVITPANHFAIRHTWAPNIWNNPEVMGLYSTIWDYPGRTLAATLTSTVSSSLINEFTFSWGSTSPSKFFGQRNCDYCPGGTTAFLYPERSEVGMTYPFLFPGTKLDPEKLPSVSLQGFTASNNNAYPGSWNDFVFQWSDNMTKIRGNHTVKAGFNVERSGMNDQIQLSFAQPPATPNQNGSFRFFDTRPGGTGLSASNALLGLFDDYTEFGAKPNTRWLAMGYDAFLQDSWKTTQKLTLELGLRYSVWQPWGAKDNELASFNPQYYNPAVAAVVDPRGGFIISGDPYNGITLPGDKPTAQALTDFPQLADLQRLYHGVPNGFSSTPKNGFQPRLGLAYAINEKTTVRTGAGLFLNRVQINTTAAYGFNPPLSAMTTVINGNVDQPAGAQVRSFPLVMAMQDPNFTNPRSWAWNATLDRELPGQIRAQVSYIGRDASHLERARNINQLQPGTIQANPGINTNALRPYLGFGSITLYETTGRSRYNSMQLQVERRTAGGLGFSAAYTLSRTRDDGSGRGDILPNAYSDAGYYGISDLDRTHVFVSQVHYHFPDLDRTFAPVRWVLGRWDVSGIFQAQSGVPFSIRSIVDYAGVGPGSGSQFLNIVGDPTAGRADFNGTQAVWFDKNAFQPPAPGTFAIVPKNTLRQPGFWDFNMSIRKSFPVTGSQRLEFRADAFNVLNHPHLSDAGTNPLTGDFGLITSKTGNRTMQVGVQYVF